MARVPGLIPAKNKEVSINGLASSLLSFFALYQPTSFVDDMVTELQPSVDISKILKALGWIKELHASDASLLVIDKDVIPMILLMRYKSFSTTSYTIDIKTCICIGFNFVHWFDLTSLKLVMNVLRIFSSLSSVFFPLHYCW